MVTETITALHFLLASLGLLLLAGSLCFSFKPGLLLALLLCGLDCSIHYHISGGEIFGMYFNYTRSVVYSLDVIVCIISVYFLSFDTFKKLQSHIVQFGIQGVLLGATLSCLVLLTNIWLNASFIATRLQKTPIFQVALLEKKPYCSYHYLFYKINPEGKSEFMCPNQYGLLPAIGQLENPEFITRDLPQHLQARFKSRPYSTKEKKAIT